MSKTEKKPIDQSAKIESKTPPPCPKCGKELVIKKRDADDPPFWGCSGSPACTYSRDALSGTF